MEGIVNVVAGRKNFFIFGRKERKERKVVPPFFFFFPVFPTERSWILDLSLIKRATLPPLCRRLSRVYAASPRIYAPLPRWRERVHIFLAEILHGYEATWGKRAREKIFHACRFGLREDRLRVISAKSSAKRTRQLLFRSDEGTNWRNVQPVKRIGDRNERGWIYEIASRQIKHDHRMKSRPARHVPPFYHSMEQITQDPHIYFHVTPELFISTNISNRSIKIFTPETTRFLSRREETRTKKKIHRK